MYKEETNCIVSGGSNSEDIGDHSTGNENTMLFNSAQNLPKHVSFVSGPYGSVRVFSQ